MVIVPRGVSSGSLVMTGRPLEPVALEGREESTMSTHDQGSDLGGPVTRRKLLRTAGVTGLGLAGGSLLAACGGSNSGSSTAAATASKVTADGQKLNSILGITSKDLALTK